MSTSDLDILFARFSSVNTPHPAELWLPRQPYNTRLGQDYIRWEAHQLRTCLAALPEPKAPPTEKQFQAECRRLQELVKFRKYANEHWTPIFPTLLPHQQAKASRDIAHACWQEKILRCRVVRIHQFPPEIVVHVLEFLLEDNLDFYRVRLSAVCRQWRELVVKMPRLWQNVWLNDVAPHTVSASFMERAQSLPLTIRVGERKPRRSVPNPEPVTPADMHAQLDVVLPKLAQIRSLTVIVKSWPASYTFLERAYMCPIEPSQLQVVRFHRTSAGYADLAEIASETNDGRHLLLFRGRAAKLHTLTTDGVHLDWSIPLSELDALDMRRMPIFAMPTWDRFTQVAHLSPHLRELTLDGCTPKFSLLDEDLPSQRLLLPGLRMLAFGGMSVPFLLRLAYLLDTPRLVELSLKHYESLDHDWTPVFQMLTGVYPLLRILQLNTVRVSSQPSTTGVIARFFMSLKSVQVVRLINMHESFLNHFLEDGRYYLDPTTPPVMTSDMRRAIEANHPMPIRMLPALTTVIYDSVLTQEIVRFANTRRTLGLPLTRLYAHLSWYFTLGPEEKRLLYQIPGFSTLAVAFHLYACPEEQAIWREVEGPNAIIRTARV